MARSADRADSYLNSLGKEVRDRYEEKIRIIGGVNPFSIPDKELSNDPKLFPKVTHGDVVNYLVFTTSYYSLDQVKAFKSLDSFKYFVDGWVKSVRCAVIFDHCLVVGTVLHSQRLSEKPLRCWVIAKPCGSVISAHCLCMAGLGEVCSHVGALLFAVDHGVRSLNKDENEDGLSVTQKLCYWAPPTLKSVPYATIDNIDFSTPQKKLDLLRKGEAPGAKPRVIEINVPPANNEEITSLLQCALDLNIKSGLHLHHEPFCSQFATESAYPPLLSSLFKKDFLTKSLEELQNISLNTVISFTKEQAQALESVTRKQSKSTLWFQHRRGRITASNFKAACCTSVEKPSISLLKKICYQSIKVCTVATQYGQTNEEKALRLYQLHSSRQHQNFAMTKCGLVLNPKMPFLGSTPDSMVTCTCCGNGCVEVKCPHNLKDASLEDAGATCLDVGADGKPISLKRNHEYYYQVQAQLFVTELSYCDFVVLSGRDFFVQRIHADEEFWKTELPKAELLFYKVILSELLGKAFTWTDVAIASDVASILETEE